MAKYCLILHCPDFYGDPYTDFRYDPGAAHLVDVKYGDKAEDLWFKEFKGLKYQLYALDTGERVGNNVYLFGNLAEDIYEADNTERELPDISWIAKHVEEEDYDY